MIWFAHVGGPSGFYRGLTARVMPGRLQTLVCSDCGNHLINLVSTGILSLNSFEPVMNRFIALVEYDSTLGQLEWMVLAV